MALAEQITTRLADMRSTEDGTNEVHFREGLDLDVEGLAEIQARRHELTTERCGMIAFFQPGTLAEMEVMQVDLFGPTKAADQLIALAIVSQDKLGDAMSSIYYSYHPQAFPTRMFRSEAEARTWMKQQISAAK